MPEKNLKGMPAQSTGLRGTSYLGNVAEIKLNRAEATPQSTR